MSERKTSLQVDRMEFIPIGFVRSCFKEKFGIPRQSGLAPSATGYIELIQDSHLTTALRGMESFSHLWVIFIFHQNDSNTWKPTIRPPRLGGAKKVGVLASRSPHRPNPIGLSAVKFDRIETIRNRTRIYISGHDLLDGTPVLDVKPYVPYADCLPQASGGWVDQEVSLHPVRFASEAFERWQSQNPEGNLDAYRQLVEETLGLDPRPAFQRKREPIDEVGSQGGRYGYLVQGWDVRWEIRNQEIYVLEIVPESEAILAPTKKRLLTPSYAPDQKGRANSGTQRRPKASAGKG